MVVLAPISDPPVVARILIHLGLASTPPVIAPARGRHDRLVLGALGRVDEAREALAKLANLSPPNGLAPATPAPRPRPPAR